MKLGDGLPRQRQHVRQMSVNFPVPRDSIVTALSCATIPVVSLNSKLGVPIS
jgi:hypothetical protein